MYKKLLAAALSFVALPLAAASAPKSYECDFTAHTNYGWIPEKAHYVVDEAAGTALAYDKYIHHTKKAPIATEFRLMKSEKYFLSWTLTGIPVQGWGTATATYKVRLDTSAGKASMTVRVHSGDWDHRGTATCKRIK